ncbi:MAG: ion transporter [Bacteroidia bacterium]
MAAERSLKQKIFDIIFEADTPSGKAFDVALLVLILLSVIIIMMESVPEYDDEYGSLLHTLDWIITGLFTIEYGLRIWCLESPGAISKAFMVWWTCFRFCPCFSRWFLGSGSNVFMTIRALRLLRVFRVLRITNYLVEAQSLSGAIRASRIKILVFSARS